MLIGRWFVCGILLGMLLTTSAAEPLGPKPPASGAPSVRLGTGTLVLYPVPNQTDVPTTFPGNEVPDPIPLAKSPQAGYPITASFTPRMVITTARGQLFDDAMQEVPAWFSSPQEPANLKHKSSQQNSLCLFPKAPLKPATKYTVHLACKVNGALLQRKYAFTTATESDPIEAIGPVVERLNHYRQAAGLEKVEVDRELSSACQAHARYLARNLPEKRDLELRDQNPALPGSTPEGRKVAPTTVTLRSMIGLEPIEYMVGMYTNRATALHPGLKKIGIGVTRDPIGGELWVLELRRFAEPFVPPPPTCFPSPNAREVPLLYPARATLHPVADPKQRDRAGYAITAQCWTRSELTNIETKLRKKDGDAVECWRSTPSEPAVADVRQNAIMLVPKTPLEPATVYEVQMSASIDGKPWRSTWTFTTEAASARQGERGVLEAKALALLNAYRATCGLTPAQLDATLSAACAKHAEYLKVNLGHPSTVGLGMHNEDPKLPGYTPEGAKAGKASVIATSLEPLASLTGWMDTLYHRIPLIDPRVQKVGFGAVPLADGRWICVMHAHP